MKAKSIFQDELFCRKISMKEIVITNELRDSGWQISYLVCFFGLKEYDM